MTTNELTYKILKTSDDVEVGVAVSNGTTIPFDPANSDYQRFLDEINEHGLEIVEGDLPESVVTAAAEKKFEIQLANYQRAVARLAQYLVSEGCEEVTEMLPSVTTSNPITGQPEQLIAETVVQVKIDPVPATIKIWEPVDGSSEVVEKTVRNPLIVQDEAERAAAQVIVDATPEEVKVAAAGE